MGAPALKKLADQVSGYVPKSRIRPSKRPNEYIVKTPGARSGSSVVRITQKGFEVTFSWAIPRLRLGTIAGRASFFVGDAAGRQAALDQLQRVFSGPSHVRFAEVVMNLNRLQHLSEKHGGRHKKRYGEKPASGSQIRKQFKTARHALQAISAHDSEIDHMLGQLISIERKLNLD